MSGMESLKESIQKIGFRVKSSPNLAGLKGQGWIGDLIMGEIGSRVDTTQLLLNILRELVPEAPQIPKSSDAQVPYIAFSIYTSSCKLKIIFTLLI